MQSLDSFSKWMEAHSKLSENSIAKYTGAIRTISKDMLDEEVINKSLMNMNQLEIDFSIPKILSNSFFQKKNLTGKRMYSNAIKQFRYYTFESVENKDFEKKLEQSISQSTELNSSEKETIIKARIGQGKYRLGLLEKYSSQCVVTGINHKKLLIASHIKPWSVSRNDERIDVENGLLLSPTMDRLFDCGLITFSNKGQMNKTPLR